MKKKKNCVQLVENASNHSCDLIYLRLVVADLYMHTDTDSLAAAYIVLA